MMMNEMIQNSIEAGSCSVVWLTGWFKLLYLKLYLIV